MKSVKLSTRTRNILICVFSVVGIFISNFGSDICSWVVNPTMIIVDGVEKFKFKDEKNAWWELRMIVAETSDALCFIILKFFQGFGIPNMLFNIGLWLSLSDCVDRIGGENQRDIWDFAWAGLTIILSYYDFRKRQRSVHD